MSKNKEKKKEEEKPKNLSEEEKEELEQEGELPPKKTRNKETKQIAFFVILIIIFFGSFLGPYFWVQSQRVFEYNNLTWQVEKDEDVTFYHTMFGKYYKGEARGNHHTYLRHDPRKNEIHSEVIEPQFFQNVVISTDPELLECGKQILVTDALGQMTFALPFINNPTFAINDEEYAKENNKEYYSCEDRPKFTTIIEVVKSDESRISQDKSGDCYFIEIAECEDNLLVAEKFILDIITNLRNSQPTE